MAVSGILFTDLTGIKEDWWAAGAQPTALPFATLIAIEVRAPRSCPSESCVANTRLLRGRCPACD